MKKYLAIAFVLCFAVSTYSQVNTVEGKQNTWFFWLNNAKLSNKWNLFTEFHLRQSAPFADNANFLFRPGIDFKLNEDVIFSGGYTYIRNYPNNPFPAQLATTEHNLWQQVILKHQSGKVKFLHRFRQEERYLQQVETLGNGEVQIADETRYVNRFRYRLQLQVPLFKVGEKAISVTVFDEIWFNQANNLAPQNFNRNWIYAGIDVPISSKATVHLGYLDQLDQRRPQQFVQRPVVQLMVSSSLIDLTTNKK